MGNNQKICCVTGHRPKGFPWHSIYGSNIKYDNELKLTIAKTIEELINDGYTHFICGGAIGIDTIFAKEVLNLRSDRYPDITLEIAVPCPEQDKKWSSSDKKVYDEIILLANEVNIISDRYSKFCFHRRNEYMVDKSDLVLVVWNGQPEGGTYATYQYSLRKEKPIKLLLMSEIMQNADITN